jgi:hypothetical protein
MKQGIGFGTMAGVLLAGSVLLAPALQARQCSGNGDVVGSYGFTGSRSGFFLLGATAAGPNSPSGSGPMIPVPVTPPGTSGTTVAFTGSNTGIGNLLSGIVNPNVFSSVGRVFADGMGNLYASPNTGLMTNILAGSYTVSTSCSITMTLTDPFVTNSGTQTTGVNPTPGTPIMLTGYVTGNATELDMFGTNGAVVTFLKTSQGGNCDNSSLSGNFTVSGQGFYLPSAGSGQVLPGTTVGQPPVTPTGPTGPCLNGQTGTNTGTGQTGACTGAFTSGATGTLGTPFSLLARLVANGSGMLTTDFSGQQSSGQNVTGTYSVNSDCTGTAHLVDSAGIARNISFVLVNQAAQCFIGASPQSSARQALEFVFSDPGVMGSGIAQVQ